VPLEFLKRRGRGDDRAASPPAAIPEETSAQEYLLKLFYAGKSSESVRMKAGPRAMAELPAMLAGIATGEIVVIQPLRSSSARPARRSPIRPRRCSG